MIRLLLGIAGILLLAVLIGAVLPRRARRRHDALIAAPPEQIWPLLTDPSRRPALVPGVEAVEALPGGRWRERRKDGAEQVVRILDSEPMRRLRWSIEETHGASRAIWTFALTPEGEGTRLRAVQRDDVRGPLSRFLALLRGGRDVGLLDFVEGVKGAGERPQDEPAGGGEASSIV